MPSPHRARIAGSRHMAAAGHYLAAQAAFQVLEAGGNAVDAGVAGGIALGVLQSEFVSFAGVAPIMIRMAKTRETVTITGLGWWPKRADIEVFRREHNGHIPDGILSTVMPAAPDSWITALERYGTMGFGDVARAAIRFAKDGFPANTLLCEVIESHLDEYKSYPTSAKIYLPGGRPPKPGEMFVQRDLGATLQFIADEERKAARRKGRKAGLKAARDAFYKGDIAAAMVRFHKRNGGWLTAEDLAGFHVELRPPLKIRYGDVEIYACGPWCQGPVVPQTLTILDGVDLASLGHNSPAYVHVVTEALKLAFADRHHYYGDPNFVDVPMKALLSPAYAAHRRTLIRPDKAAPGMPAPGAASELARAVARPEPTKGATKDLLDTSYVCVVDGQGNLFSATPSDGSSSGPVVPGLGFVPSTRGTQSWADPSVPACLAPGKRPRLTPNPAIAIRPGKWMMPFGTPGNDVQVQAMVQVVLNLVGFGMEMQRAVEEPRFATVSFPRSSEPHAYYPGRLHVEGRIAEATRGALSRLGHEVVDWPDWAWRAGEVCAIRRDLKTGVLEGAADPRRPSGVVGW